MFKALTPLLICTSIVSTLSLQADFGDSFGGSLLGSTIGTTVGTVVGNAITAPRPVRTITTVKEVPVTVEIPVRRTRRLERAENRLILDLQDLRSQKNALERKIRALERELSDIEATIEANQQALENIRQKKADALVSVSAPIKTEFAEVTVR